jgi:hypothetical protein
MKARKFLSACSMALALMVVAPALAQEQELLTQEAQEQELLAIPFFVRRVAVECNGECGDSTLGQICGSGWRPIAVDCGNVENWPGSDPFVFACGGDNRCRLTSVLSSHALSLYCDDGGGWDANVYCAQ